MKNNNQPAVRLLSARSLGACRTRNAFALLAIILTTFMISTVFSIGVSFGKNLNIMTRRLAGTTAEIFLTHPTDEQLDFIANLDGVDAVGMQYSIGSLRGKTAEGKDLAVSVLAFDKSEWENHISPCAANITGSYPQKTNEVMLSAKALEQLAVSNPQIGMTVPLTYRSNGETLTADFTLTGWFDEYDATQSKGMALFSESYCASNGLTPEQDARVCISASSGRSSDKIYSLLIALIGEDYQKNLSSTYHSQEGENSLIIFATIVMIALFIVFSGYLLIYNIMYISVTKDIRFYGMLKTIGTSPKQIKKIVFRQALLLSLIGIPVGLILGVATSFGIVPTAIGALAADDLRGSAMPGDISFSPLIFIGTALFSLLTIIVSCRKPARVASRVSPVEAAKYTGVSDKHIPKNRKTTNGGNLGKMAFHNVFRERKRAFIVFASLFMGTVTFLSVNSVFSSLDVNNYISRYNPNDFSYQSSPPISEEKFDSAFIDELNKIEGITNKEFVYSDYVYMPFSEETFKPVLEDTVKTYGDKVGTYENILTAMKNYSAQVGYGTWAVSLADHYTESLTDFDLDAFHRGETCIVAYGEYADMLGKTIEVKSEKTGKVKSLRIAGYFTGEEGYDLALFSYTVGTLAAVFVSDECMQELNSEPVITNITLDVKEKYEPAVEARLKQLNASLTNQTFIFNSRSDVAENFESSMRTMNILMGGISILLILIGIINFINVMTTGIFTRRREFAVLESIGMTKCQIYRMLTFEGGFYALFTSLLILLPGSGIMMLVGRAMPMIADYAKFEYPFVTVLLLIAAIVVVCLFVPPLVHKITSTESVTERLHTTDN